MYRAYCFKNFKLFFSGLPKGPSVQNWPVSNFFCQGYQKAPPYRIDQFCRFASALEWLFCNAILNFAIEIKYTYIDHYRSWNWPFYIKPINNNKSNGLIRNYILYVRLGKPQKSFFFWPGQRNFFLYIKKRFIFP